VNEETGVYSPFIYWFGDEQGVTIANTWRKLFGPKTNWSLYVVWADNPNASAEDSLTVPAYP